MRRTLTCVEYNEDVYNDAVVIDVEEYSDIGVGIIRITEYIRTQTTVIEPVVQLAWGCGGLYYDVGYKKTADSEYTTIRVYNNSAEILGLEDLTYYDFKVTASNGATQTRTYLVRGKSTQFPADVINLRIKYNGNQAALTWDAVIDARGGIDYEIRKGTIWESGNALGFTTSTEYPLSSSGSYMVKARYIYPSGAQILSVHAAIIDVTDAIIPTNIVATIDEYATLWLGNKVNMFIAPSGYLQTAPTTLFDNYPLIDSVNNMDWYGGAALSAQYTIPTTHIVDVTVAQLVNIWIEYEAIAANINDLIDFRLLIDDWEDVDGVTAVYTIQFQIQIAGNDGVFGTWQNFTAGNYVGRKFNFMVLLTSASKDTTIIFKQFKIIIDMQDKTQDNGATPTIIPAEGAIITYPLPFQVPPQIFVTIADAVAGDIINMPSAAITATTFSVQITNSGVGVQRAIYWMARGY